MSPPSPSARARSGTPWTTPRAPFVAKNAKAKAAYDKKMQKYKTSRVYLKYLEDKKAAVKQMKAEEKAAKKAAKSTPKKAAKKVTKRRKSVRKTVRKTKKTARRKSRKSARKTRKTT